jgi:hypothetical protein
MRPRFYTFLCLLPFALAAATLSLLATTDLAPLTDPELLKALDPSGEEELWRAQRRCEDKRHVTCALLDGRLTLRQAAARFLEIDTARPAKARAWALPEYTEDEWACRQVIFLRRFRTRHHAAEPRAGEGEGLPAGGGTPGGPTARGRLPSGNGAVSRSFPVRVRFFEEGDLP